MSFTGLMLRVGSREALINIELLPARLLKSSSDGKVCICFDVARESLNELTKDGMKLSAFFITTPTASDDEEKLYGTARKQFKISNDGQQIDYVSALPTTTSVTQVAKAVMASPAEQPVAQIIHQPKQSTFYSMIHAFTSMKF